MPRVYSGLKPFWSTTDGHRARLYLGDVVEVLRHLPAGSVQCVVTSPPYWNLRDYKTGSTKEIGSEASPTEFVAKMVEVFAEVRRVLRDDGVCWLNLGDSYASGGGHTKQGETSQRKGRANVDAQNEVGQTNTSGLSSGNLVGIPWRVALALQADGWILRQDIIWHKPSPMPESVRNRCTKAHEYVFLLAKQQGYYYDAEAIKEKALQPEGEPKQTGEQKYLELGHENGQLGTNQGASHRNRRSVWTISSQGYPGAHFATFPPKLVEPCILAGSSAYGACALCGAPFRRLVEEQKLTRERPHDYVKRTGAEGTGNSCANSVAGVESRTVGWEPTCVCRGVRVKRTVKVSKRVIDSASEKNNRRPAAGMHSDKSTLATFNAAETHEEEAEETVWEYAPNPGTTVEDHPVRPCVVLDPFIGSGTTICVALDHGRSGWGIDLSETYLLENAVPRIEQTLAQHPALVGISPRIAAAKERVKAVGGVGRAAGRGIGG